MDEASLASSLMYQKDPFRSFLWIRRILKKNITFRENLPPTCDFYASISDVLSILTLSTMIRLILASLLVLSLRATAFITRQQWTSPAKRYFEPLSHSFSRRRRGDDTCFQAPITSRRAATQDDDETASPKRLGLFSFISRRSSRFEKFVDKLFDEADTNNDGTVELGEVYEMVLQMYIKLNRQAPIPPPSRAKVLKIFKASDVDHNNRISREEFTSLTRTLGRRAMARLVAHKAVTLIGAPLLATEIVQIFRQHEFVRKRMKKYAAAVIPDNLEAELLSTSFARTALIIIFVATLGNVTIALVNFLLDLSMPNDDDEDETYQQVKD